MGRAGVGGGGVGAGVGIAGGLSFAGSVGAADIVDAPASTVLSGGTGLFDTSEVAFSSSESLEESESEESVSDSELESAKDASVS